MFTKFENPGPIINVAARKTIRIIIESWLTQENYHAILVFLICVTSGFFHLLVDSSSVFDW